PQTGTETLAIFFVPAGVTDDLAVIQAIRRRVTARLGIAPGFIVPLLKENFPKTTSGKIQRTQLKKALESGALISSPTAKEESEVNDAPAAQSDIQKAVAEIWQEVLNQNELHPRA